MSKHTPGPWAVVEFKKIVSRNPSVVAGGVGHYEHVATVESQPETEIEDANAFLLAAAPDLLAALKQIIREDNESGEVSDDAILSAVQAVAKALGGGV